MAGIGLLNCVNGQCANGIDRQLVGSFTGHGLLLFYSRGERPLKHKSKLANFCGASCSTMLEQSSFLPSHPTDPAR
jgi:hypothetical protein